MQNKITRFLLMTILLMMAVGANTALAQEDKKELVAFFSVTGNTKEVAEKIASITDSDVYEIIPDVPYTDDDIDYNDNDSRTTHEQNDPEVRPAIASEDISMMDYDVIYLGYPIWWGQEPRIMDTFVESYDFEGITIIPFCTSVSSGIENSEKNLEKNAESGTWLEGKRFSADVSEEDLIKWMQEVTEKKPQL